MIRKLLFLFVLILGTIESYSQIQERLFGYKLASTTKSEVLEDLKSKNENYEVSRDGNAIHLKNKTFEGHLWQYVGLLFYNDIFYQVSLCTTAPPLDKSQINDLWVDLSKSLKDKYSNYFVEKGSDSVKQIYNGDVTSMFIWRHSLENSEIITMTYFNELINDLKKEYDKERL